jgi:hypothetical protein
MQLSKSSSNSILRSKNSDLAMRREFWVGCGRTLSYVVYGVKGTPNWRIVKACITFKEAEDYVNSHN